VMAKEYAKKLTQLIHLVIRKTNHATNAPLFMTGLPLSTAPVLPKFTVK
jgi:hypothetical protein